MKSRRRASSSGVPKMLSRRMSRSPLSVSALSPPSSSSSSRGLARKVDVSTIFRPNKMCASRKRRPMMRQLRNSRRISLGGALVATSKSLGCARAAGRARRHRPGTPRDRRSAANVESLLWRRDRSPKALSASARRGTTRTPRNHGRFSPRVGPSVEGRGHGRVGVFANDAPASGAVGAGRGRRFRRRFELHIGALCGRPPLGSDVVGDLGVRAYGRRRGRLRRRCCLGGGLLRRATAASAGATAAAGASAVLAGGSGGSPAGAGAGAVAAGGGGGAGDLRAAVAQQEHHPGAPRTPMPATMTATHGQRRRATTGSGVPRHAGAAEVVVHLDHVDGTRCRLLGAGATPGAAATTRCIGRRRGSASGNG